jgi:vitamin B12 transporter
VLAGVIQTKLSYTRLEADDLTDETPLLRRPHYEANLDLWHEFSRGFSLGGGAGWVGTRADVDAQTFDTIYDPSYAVARIYAAWKINQHLTLKLRIENALNKYYEPVNGYPALGRGIFGGAEWKF